VGPSQARVLRARVRHDHEIHALHRMPEGTYEADRGSAAQRGYGYAHRKAAARAKADATHCTQCGTPFTADNPATGGHLKAIRNGGSAGDGIEAQCRRCNYGWRRTGL
jgi:hypothetical protein